MVELDWYQKLVTYVRTRVFKLDKPAPIQQESIDSLTEAITTEDIIQETEKIESTES